MSVPLSFLLFFWISYCAAVSGNNLRHNSRRRTFWALRSCAAFVYSEGGRTQTDGVNDGEGRADERSWMPSQVLYAGSGKAEGLRERCKEMATQIPRHRGAKDGGAG